MSKLISLVICSKSTINFLRAIINIFYSLSFLACLCQNHVKCTQLAGVFSLGAGGGGVFERSLRSGVYLGSVDYDSYQI